MFMRLFLLLLSLPFAIGVTAQTTGKQSYYLSARHKRGFLAAHRGVMGHLPKEPAVGVEISLYKKFSDDKKWSKPYRYPYAGVTLYGSTVGNNAILGQAFGVYGFIEFPMNRGERHQLTGKVSTGLGYMTKVFDQETNPKNVAISTHFNALICLGIQGRVRLADRHHLLYGLDLTHLSNGSYRVPNLGLNMPYLSLGYEYKIKEKDFTLPEDIPQIAARRYPFFGNWKLNLQAILSTKQVFPTGEKNYPVYAFAVTGRKIFRTKVGMETTFDIMSKQAIFGYKRYIPKTQWTVLQLGVYVGYVLPLDHFQFVVGMGRYVKNRYDPDGWFYHRVGMRYQFNNGITANLVLKSHWAKADYIEWGVGYTFNYKKR